MNNTDKYIFFMPAGEMQSSTVEFFKHNNFKIILCDGNPEAFLKPQADIFLSFDIFNLDECEKNLDKLINNINIVAAYTSSADCHKSIAHISEKIGSRLTWNTHISDVCGDKHKTRKFLDSICRQPQSMLVSNHDDLKLCYKTFGSKEVVLKPLDSSGSRGFQAFRNIHDINQQDFSYTKSFSKSCEIILEEKISRSKKYISELSVEALYFKGDFKIINVVDRVFVDDIKKLNNLQFLEILHLNEGVEVGHINPTFLPEQMILKIQNLYKKIFPNLVFDEKLATLKLDIMIDETEEPIVLEMTPRTSGGWDSCYSNIITGGNLLKNLLNYVMGIYSASETFNNTLSYEKIQKRVFVLGVPEDNSPNCIGRIFFAGDAAEITAPLPELLKRSITKYKIGEKIEPIKII